MANREVNLTKRVNTTQGLRYCAAVLSANVRVKPDVVLVNGKEETQEVRITSSAREREAGAAVLVRKSRPMIRAAIMVDTRTR